MRKLILFTSALVVLAASTACHRKSKSKGQGSQAGASAGDTSSDASTSLFVNAGPNIQAKSEVFLDATSSQAVKWQWEQLAGPGTLVFQSPQAEDTAVFATKDGYYWIRLTVTAADGTEAYDDLEMLWDTTAPCPKLPSELKAFQPRYVEAQVPDDATTFVWSQISGPGRVNFNPPGLKGTSLIADQDGVYGLRLTASDALGNSCSGDMRFVWETTVPAVSVGDDIETNKEVLIDASSRDAVSFRWTKVSGPGEIAFQNPNAEDTRVSASVDGTYVLRLTITTLAGQMAFDELNFTWDSTPPQIELPMDFAVRYRATLDAHTRDAVSFQWSKVSGPGLVTFSSPKTEDTALIVDFAGDYEISLQASDRAGNLATARVRIAFAADPTAYAQQVSGGGSHSCAVLDDQGVACWGYNYQQELGYGDEDKFGEGKDRYAPPSFPIDLGNNAKARTVSANYSHTCAILGSGSVKCWGQNASGQLGYGDTTRRPAPDTKALDLGAGRTATRLATGFSHSCALLDDGSIKCWGSNASGQLGYGDYRSRSAPEALPIALGSGRSAKAITAGAYHTCAVLDDDSIRCWGLNVNGQLGLGDTRNRNKVDATAIDIGPGLTLSELTAGAYHTCALLSDGRSKCWGRNSKGQLGYGDTSDRTRPDPTTLNVGSGRSAIALSAGLNHTCALMDDSQVQCWGDNEEGQLGTPVGPMVTRPEGHMLSFAQGRRVKAISAGRLHNCALLEDNTLSCWGSNSYGQLGAGKDVIETTPAVEVVTYKDE